MNINLSKLELDKKALSIINISIKLQQNLIIKNLHLELNRGEIGCIIGHSSGGKTTLLNAIAGFIPIESGKIFVNNQMVCNDSLSLPTEKRGLGMLFQDYALFPHLTIEKNISFGLLKKTAQYKKERVSYLLKLFGLSGLEKKYPHQLSGGQQQRAALARALAPQPKLLLLDEPFSHLDPEIKEQLIFELKYILKKTATSTLMVTHDQKEAFAIGDRVGVLIAGRISQWDVPQKLYNNPKDRMIADFVGEGAIIRGLLVSDFLVTTLLGPISSKYTLQNCPGLTIEVLVRPQDVELTNNSNIKGKLIYKSFRGSSSLYLVQLSDESKIYVEVAADSKHEIGDTLAIKLKNKNLTIFAPGIFTAFNY